MVFRPGGLQNDARVVARTAVGPIIEVIFKGRPLGGCGPELYRYMVQVLQDMEPAGIVMNFAKFKMGSWDDIGPVFTQLIGKCVHGSLPLCIVANKRATKSLTTMFKAMQLTEILKPKFVNDAGIAIGYLEHRLRDAGSDPVSRC